MNFNNPNTKTVPETFRRNSVLALTSAGLFAAMGSIGLVRSDLASASEPRQSSASAAIASCRKQTAGGSALIPPGFKCDLELVRAAALLRGRSDLATLRADSSLHPFQLSDRKLQEAIDKVCVEAKQLPVTTDVQGTSEKILRIAQNVLSQYFQGTPPSLELAFVTLEGNHEYCTRNVAYDYSAHVTAGASFTPGNAEYERYAALVKPSRFLASSSPTTICLGGAILERDMAACVGIKSRCVDVQQFHGLNTSERPMNEHAVAEFLLPGGLPAYADWSFGRGEISNRNTITSNLPGKSDAVYGLPRNAGSLELFIRRNGDFLRSNKIAWQKVSQVTPLTCVTESSFGPPMTSFSYTQWKEYNLLHDRSSSTFCGYDDTHADTHALRKYCITGKRFYAAGH